MQGGGENEIRITISADNRDALAKIQQVIEATQSAANQARTASQSPLVGPSGAPIGSLNQASAQNASNTQAQARANEALARSLERLATQFNAASAAGSSYTSSASQTVAQIDAQTLAVRQLGSALSALAANRSGLRALGQVNIAGAGGGVAGGGQSGPVMIPGQGPSSMITRGVAGGGGGYTGTPTPIIPGGGGGVNPVPPQAVQNANGLNLALGNIALRVAQFKLINEVFNDVSASIGYAASESVKFQTNMMRIAALTSASKQEIASWNGEIRQLAMKGPSTANELAEAMYFVSSSGLSGTKALAALNAANLGAAAGMGDVQDIAKVLVATMNAYGDRAGSAVDIMDQFTAAAKAGSAEAADYANHLGAIIPIASQAGISLQQLLAFVATGTNVGLPTSQVATGTRALIENIVAPRKEALQEMKELGLNRQQLRQMMSQDFGKFVTDINKRASESGPDAIENLDKLIPNIRALTVLMAAVGPDGGDKYIQVMKDVANFQGKTAESSQAFSGSAERSAIRVRNAWTELGLTVGEKVNPALSEMLELLLKIAGAPQPQGPSPTPGKNGVTGVIDAEGTHGQPIESYQPVKTPVEKPQSEIDQKKAEQQANMAVAIAAARKGESEGIGGALGFDVAGAKDLNAALNAAAQASAQGGKDVGQGFADGINSTESERQHALADMGKIVSDFMGQANLDSYMSDEAEKIMHEFDLAIQFGGDETLNSVTRWAENFKKQIARDLALDPALAQSLGNQLDAIIMGGLTSGDRSQVNALGGFVSGYNRDKDQKYIDKTQEDDRKRKQRQAEQDIKDAERKTRTAARGFREAWADEEGRRGYQETMGVEGAKAAQSFVDAFANAADFENGAMDKGRAVVNSVKALTDKAKELGIPEWRELGDLAGSAMLSALDAKLSGDPMAETMKNLAMDALGSLTGAIQAREKFTTENVFGGRDFQRVMDGYQGGGGATLGLYQAMSEGLDKGGITAQRQAQQAMGGIMQELSKIQDRDLAIQAGREIMSLVADGLNDGTDEALEAARQGINRVLQQARVAQAQYERDKAVTEAKRQYNKAIQQIERDWTREETQYRHILGITSRQERDTTGLQRDFEDQRSETTFSRESAGIGRQQRFEDFEKLTARAQQRAEQGRQRELSFAQNQRAQERAQKREDAATERQRAFEDSEKKLSGQVMDPKEAAALKRRRAFEDTEKETARDEAKKEAEDRQRDEIEAQSQAQQIQNAQQDQQIARQRAFQESERQRKETDRKTDLAAQRTFEDDMLQVRKANEEELRGVQKYYQSLAIIDQKGELMTTLTNSLVEASTAYNNVVRDIYHPLWPEILDESKTIWIDPMILYLKQGLRGVVSAFPGYQGGDTSDTGETGDSESGDSPGGTVIHNHFDGPITAVGSGGIKEMSNIVSDNMQQGSRAAHIAAGTYV